jgi:hypothetical protein
MKDTITLPAHITPDQFGCERPFFERFVKGKPLKVVGYLNAFFTVRVHRALYTVSERDLKERYDGLPDFIREVACP